MRTLCILLLAFSMVGETTALFNVLGNIIKGVGKGIGNIIDLGLTTLNKVVDTGVKVGKTVIGVVVDPFCIWKSSADDHGHITGQVTKCPAIADIIFVLDTSSSMSLEEFELEKQFAIRLSEHFRIGSKDVRFAAIVFSDVVRKVFDLGTYSNYSAIKLALSRAPHLGGNTKTNEALDFIREQNMFSTTAGARDKSSKILIVITDGQSDSLFRTKAAAEVLKNQGVRLVVVGIGSGLGIELYNIASCAKNVFRADSFNSLVKIEQRVARRTCEIPEGDGYVPKETDSSGASCQKGFIQNPSNPETCIDDDECARRNPCQQNCINLIGSFRCTCEPGYAIDVENATRCTVIPTCKLQADIIFVLDASGSIGIDNFQAQQDFVARITRHFSFGRTAVLFGALIFSTEVQKLFGLNTFTSQTAVAESLLNAPYLTGGTNTYLALKYIRENSMFSTANGGRSSAPDTVIILTDGMSSRSDLTLAAASDLKNDGARIITLGIGDQISVDELAGMASSSQDTFAVGDFDFLAYVEKSLTERVCPKSSSG